MLGLATPTGSPARDLGIPLVMKQGSASAEMHGTAAERRAARLKAVGVGDRATRRRPWARSEETVPLLDGFDAAPAPGTEGNTLRDWDGRGHRSIAPFTATEDTARSRPSEAERPTLAQVIARSNARITRQIADLEASDDPMTAQRLGAFAALDTGWRPLPLSVDEPARHRFVASPEPIADEVRGQEQMTSRGRLVVDRSRAAARPAGMDTDPRMISPDMPSSSGSPADAPGIQRAHERTARTRRQEPGISSIVPVDSHEFPTPAEARSGLLSRVHALAQSSTVLERDASPESFGDQAMAELRLLQNTVTRLNDRLEVARSNMAMLAAARSSLREHERNVERIAAEGRFPSAVDAGTEAARPVQTLARRPSFPYPRDARHPHHRARIAGNPPIALVINMDNANSFDINFDGNIIFRPISATRECPDRELIARCLSMLPGGRDGTPSRWMRLTGASGSRPRRAGTSAGYWVRWVSEDAEGAEGLRHRSLDMTTLPRIIAFDFAVSPPDDECWVRADEIEFYTSHTRLRTMVGPWMHSRVRVEPFENDPPAAAWGTSAHVRQAVQQVGGLPLGHYMRYHFRERRVEALPPGQHPAPSRTAFERVRDSYEGLDATADTVPATPLGAHIGETDDPENAWLMSYEPAIGQIRASWRAHYRRTRDDDPGPGPGAAAGTRDDAGSGRSGMPRNELWSRGEFARDLVGPG